MITINAKEANMAQLLNNVEYEPVTIVGDNGRNAVLISEDEWRGIRLFTCQRNLLNLKNQNTSQTCIKSGYPDDFCYLTFSPESI